ncbi:MAG: glycosyltransferase [Pseudonocardiales bacterium]
MKIAMISEHASPLATLGRADGGGQNVHVGALSRALAARGHHVVIYTRRDAPRLPDRVPICEGVVVEHVPAGPPSAVAKDDILPFVPDFAAYLGRRLAVDPPDVVHAHFWMSGLAALQATGTLTLPIVQTFHALGSVKRRFHGSDDPSPPQRVKVETLIGRRVAQVIASCPDEVRELRRMGIGYQQVTVIPCGVDLERFQPVEGSPPPRNGVRLLSIGRLVPRKGVDDVIRALAKVPGAVTLTVAGGSPSAELDSDAEVCRLRTLAARVGVAGRVRFLGQVRHDEVPALIRAADLVVCTPWYEPFGMVALEAMACGVPIVASAVGGLQDTVIPGVTGELVPPRSPDHLAYALRRLLADPVRMQGYRFAAVDRVRAAFSWERVGEATETVYARVAARTASTSVAAQVAS